MVSRLEQATHSGGCGFCTDFGTQVAAGHGEIFALVAGVGVHHQHVGGLGDGLQPHGVALVGIDAEAAELRRAEAPCPVPHSTRPLETRSSVAMRSATRAGWL